MVKWLGSLLALFVIARGEREEQFKVSLDCSKYGTGNYVFGCNPHYWVCYNTFQYELRCYGDLVLDPDENRCNYREKVRLCTDPNLPRSQPYRALELFSCKGMANGPYSTGFCDNFFHTCNNGTKMDNPCPYQQFFDSKTNKCDFKENVDECKPENLKPRPLAQPAVPIRSDTPRVQTINAPEKPSPPRPVPKILPSGKTRNIGLAMPVNQPNSASNGTQSSIQAYKPDTILDCSQIPDGLYELDKGNCSNLFWKCANKLAHQYKCPQGLFFNIDNTQCDFIENIAACGGTNSRSNAESTDDIFGTGRDAPLMPVMATKQPITDFNCTGRLDGFYIAQACQSSYLQCVGGKTEVKTCLQGLLFDSLFAECRPKAECGKMNRLARDNTSSPSPIEHGNFGYYNQQNAIPLPVQASPMPAPKLDCHGKPDGFYELGQCQQEYVRCVYGNSLGHTCPMNLVFFNNTCDDLQKCLNPSAATPAMIPSVRSFQQDAPRSAYSASYGQQPVIEFNPPPVANTQPPTTQSTTPPDMWCQQNNKPDGFHEVGCAPYFYSCTFGFSTKIQCPTGLFYDPDEHHCNNREWIPICGGQKPTTTLAPQLDQTRPTTTPDPWCATYNMPDGLHAVGCRSYFYSCNGGTSTRLNCPSGLYFDPDEQQCMNHDLVPICGGKKPTTLPPQMNPTQPTPPPDMWCKQNNKPDGFWDVGCAAYFYSCNGGFSLRINCPSGLFYDPQDHQCNNREWIAVCGGAKPVTTTPSQMDVPRVTAPPDLFCTKYNLSDGIHAVAGCVNYFYTCNGGIATRINCPSGLFYDSGMAQCASREFVPACGGTRPLPTTTLPPQSTTPPDMWCKQNNKPDGFWDVGCAAYFYSCNGGFSLKINCPSGLFYDPDEHQCNNKAFIAICGGKKPETTTQPQMDVPRVTAPPDLFCTKYNLSDGIHAVAGCNNYFYTCNGGFATRINCPSGLFYDSDMAQCANREFVPACGGTRPLPTTTLPPHLNPTTPPDMWCKQNNKPDGFWGVGCAAYFYSCNGGFSLKINCPSGLFYDPDEHQCNNKAFIATCGGKKPEATTQPQMDAPRSTTPPDLFCTKYSLSDGIHAVAGCANYFYTCNGGFSTRINCPSGLFYDSGMAHCANRELIPACGGTRPLPTTTLPPQSTTPPDTWCRDYKMPDGIHGVVGCSNFFYACNGGFSTRINCPSNLFFDIEEEHCTNREWIAACGGQKPATTTLAPQMNPTTPPDTFCRDNNLPDGLHGVGCNTYFYACNGGFSTRLTCPGNTFFDIQELQCNNREWIVACGGQKPTTLPPQYNPTQSTPPPDMWCQKNNKPDGFWDVGCAAYFYSCNSGFSLRINCPSGLFYDPQDHQCNNREWIAVCGGAKPVTTTPSQMDAPRSTTPPDLFCTKYNLSDGIHAVAGCNNYFYTCNGGFATRINCPSGLFYDSGMAHCAHRELVPSCGGTRPLLTTTLPPHLNPTTPPDMWCQQNNKPDGMHSMGCSNHFYACNGGFSTRLTCPGNLFFDEEEEHCTNQEWIVACGGQKPTTLPPQMNPIMSTIPPDTWCQQYKMPDGLHSVGCKNFFYSCNGGFSTKLMCPTGLFYDPDEQHCTQRDVIPACGGQKPTTLPPQMNPTQPTPPPDMWCKQNNKPDGFWDVGCAAYFYSCNGGFSLKINCPSGLFYDPQDHQCNNKEWIAICGGAKPVTTTPSQMDVPRVTAPPDLFCTKYNLSDGIHAVAGCNNYFYTCNGGFSTRINCPSGLFYDSGMAQCANREFVPACGGTRPLPTTTLPPQSTTPPDMWCKQNNKPDGFWDVGCAAYFYSCNGGFSLRINCPSGLFYDPDEHQCNNKDFIAICGGKKPETTTQPQMDVPRATAKPDLFCTKYNLSDGIHAVSGCVNYFYTCNGGFATRIKCPSGLFYDSGMSQCANRELIPSCGGKRPLPTTTLSPQLNPTTPPDMWCKQNNKPDGFWDVGCAAYFYSCNGGFSLRINCPSGLFYDPDEHQCNNKAFIPICGGKKPEITTQPPVVTQPTQPPRPIVNIPVAQNPPQNSYFQKPQQQPLLPRQQNPPQSRRQQYPAIQQSGPRNAVAFNVPPESQPLSPDTTRNPCEKLPNGIYGRRCSRHFFVCTNHTTFDFICPYNQAYDARVNKCAEQSQIDTCISSSNPSGPRTQY